MSADIGVRIRKLRISYGITVERLSEMLDISQSYLGLIERGQRCLALLKLIKVCEVFHVTLDYLIFGQNEQPRTNIDDMLANIGYEPEQRRLEPLADVVKKIFIHNFTKAEIEIISESISCLLNVMHKTRQLYK